MCLKSYTVLAPTFLIGSMGACENTRGVPDEPSPGIGGALAASTNTMIRGSGGTNDTSIRRGGSGDSGDAHVGGSVATGVGGLSAVLTTIRTDGPGTGGGLNTAGASTGTSTAENGCGDGACSATETCSTCPLDCGPCVQGCTNPVFTESDKYGQYTFQDGSMVFNNIWGGDGGPQTIYACSPSNWYVQSNQPVIQNSRGEIKSYPCSKWDFGGKALNTFTSITSTFASSAPPEGVWNAAYDIWLGPGGWDIEVMVWNDYRYLATLPPGGAVSTDNPTIDGIEYYAWTYGSDYIGMAMKQRTTSGSLDFRHIFDWIVSKRWMPADAQLHAFEYGIEIAETNGKNLTFAVTDFSVSGH